MAIILRNPYNEIESFRRQFDSIFNQMAAPQNTWKPAVELYEAQDRFVLKVQLPGFEGKDLDINATREAVMIKGEYRHNQEEGLRYSEFRYGSFQRAIKLPVAIQNDNVQAEFNNGILTLNLPKVEAAVNRVVKVNLEAAEATAPQAEAEQNQDS
ncbi:MAG: Hsp20/alpha crystallin family protein [Cyanophyceae cyanobacterium]